MIKTEQTIKLATKFQIMVNWRISYKIKLEQKQIVISHKRKTADEEKKCSFRNEGQEINACSGTVGKR